MISAFAGDKRLIATCVYTKHSFIVRNILLDIGIAMGNTLDLLKPAYCINSQLRLHSTFWHLEDQQVTKGAQTDRRVF